MKAKYLIIASLVLAILTIGAVSASEDVAVDDAMATSDITEDPIEETPVDEVIEQSEDSEPLEDISKTAPGMLFLYSDFTSKTNLSFLKATIFSIRFFLRNSSVDFFFPCEWALSSC